MFLTFSSNQTFTQRNALLCSFSNLIGAFNENQYKYIINRQSESCNPTLSYPASYWYNYKGETFDNGTQIIYFLQIDNSTASVGQARLFNSMVDTTSKLMTPRTLTILSNSINHTLNKGSLMDPITYGTLRDQSRSVSISNVDYNKSSNLVIINNITTDAASAVYFVLLSKTAPIPNNEQIMNCLDGNGDAPVKCFRFLSSSATTNNSI